MKRPRSPQYRVRISHSEVLDFILYKDAWEFLQKHASETGRHLLIEPI